MTTGELTERAQDLHVADHNGPSDQRLNPSNTIVQPTSYTDAVRLVPTEDPGMFIGVQRTQRRLNVKTFDNEYPARGSADMKLVAQWKGK